MSAFENGALLPFQSNTPTVTDGERLNQLILDCLAVLEEHGFHNLTSPRIPFKNIFETDLFYESGAAVFGTLTNGSIQDRAEPKLDRKSLDHLTLECACLFRKCFDVSINRELHLNQIRKLIIHMLFEMGYKNLTHLSRQRKPVWESYKMWEVLAELDGLTGLEVMVRRKHAESFDPVNYEA